MELANMLLNKLTNSSSSIDFNKKQLSTNQEFTSFFDNAKASINNKTNYSIQKNDNYFKNQDSTYKKSESNVNENKKANNVNSKDDAKKSNVKTENEETENVKTEESKLKEVEEKDDFIKDENLAKIIIFDDKVLNQLSEILKMPSEEIMSILSSLNISVSMLKEPENLINFLQEAFNLENPVQLLSKDGIKDIMAEITDIAKSINYEDTIKSIDYTNIESSFQEVQNIIENFDLQNVKLVNLEENDFQNNVENLLIKLNGNISEVKKVDNLEEVSVVEQTTLEGANVKANNELENKHNEQNNLLNQNQSNNFSNNANSETKSDIKIELFNISEITESTKVFNATLPKTQALKNINSTEVISQILEKMKTSVKPDMTEVKILLRPEHLGEVSLKIATHNGFVTAQFTAESQKVKEIIESNFNQLKDMLNEQGINVGALEVNVSDNGQEQETFKQFENMQEKSSKRMEEIVSKSFDEETEQEEKIKLDNSQIDYAI